MVSVSLWPGAATSQWSPSITSGVTLHVCVTGPSVLASSRSCTEAFSTVVSDRPVMPVGGALVTLLL